MDAFVDSTVDRIHFLIEQSVHLKGEGMEVEAAILAKEAEQHAAELRSLRVYN